MAMYTNNRKGDPPTTKNKKNKKNKDDFYLSRGGYAALGASMSSANNVEPAPFPDPYTRDDLTEYQAMLVDFLKEKGYKGDYKDFERIKNDRNLRKELSDEFVEYSNKRLKESGVQGVVPVGAIRIGHYALMPSNERSLSKVIEVLKNETKSKTSGSSSKIEGKQNEENSSKSTPYYFSEDGLLGPLSNNPGTFDENGMSRPSSNNEEETTESQSAAQRNTSGSTTKPETFGDNEETRTTIEPMETTGVEDLAIDIPKPKLDIDVEDRKNPTTDDLLTEVKKDKDQPGMYQRLRDANEKAFKGGMLLNAAELGHNIHSYNEARNMNTDVDLDRVSPNSVRVQAPDMYSDARNDIGSLFQSAARKSRMLGGAVNPYDSRPMYDAVNKVAGQQSGINIQAANQEGQLNATSAARADQINASIQEREEQFRILKEKAKDARLTQDKKMIANTVSKLIQMPMEYEQAKFMLDKYESDEELRKNYQMWQMAGGAVKNKEIVPSDATSTGTSSNEQKK
jgi:hypothetical protein